MAKKKAKGPAEKSVTCPDCRVPVVFIHERRGPMTARTDDLNNAHQKVEHYEWWGRCESCGQAWCSQERAPSMYVLRDEIEGRRSA